MPDHAGMRTRLALLVIVLATFAGATALRLAYWQVARGDELRAKAFLQIARPVEVAAVRGTITDRNGTILAISAYRDRLAATAIIPMHTPREAVAELEYAVKTLGFRAIAIMGQVHRPTPRVERERSELANHSRWLDVLAAYQKCWAAARETEHQFTGIFPGSHLVMANPVVATFLIDQYLEHLAAAERAMALHAAAERAIAPMTYSQIGRAHV